VSMPDYYPDRIRHNAVARVGRYPARYITACGRNVSAWGIGEFGSRLGDQRHVCRQCAERVGLDAIQAVLQPPTVVSLTDAAVSRGDPIEGAKPRVLDTHDLGGEG